MKMTELFPLNVYPFTLIHIFSYHGSGHIYEAVVVYSLKEDSIMFRVLSLIFL